MNQIHTNRIHRAETRAVYRIKLAKLKKPELIDKHTQLYDFVMYQIRLSAATMEDAKSKGYNIAAGMAEGNKDALELVLKKILDI